MGLYALGEYAKKLKKQQQPAMMFDSNLQQTTPDVGAGKPNKKKKKKKKNDGLISVKTGGRLKTGKVTKTNMTGEEMVRSCYD
tara:strand:- start:2 stop:250 length:249 start_codon:yes stop_codon:yes gene_type:complete